MDKEEDGPTPPTSPASQPPPPPRSSESLSLYTCPICGRQGFNEPRMRDHLDREHERRRAPPGRSEDYGHRRFAPFLVDCPFQCGIDSLDADARALHIELRHSVEEFVSRNEEGAFQERGRESNLSNIIIDERTATTRGATRSSPIGTPIMPSSEKRKRRRRKPKNEKESTSGSNLQQFSSSADDQNVTIGLLAFLRDGASTVASSSSSGGGVFPPSRDLHLCLSVNHYATRNFDRGWGCGYRNIQMSLSSLQGDPLFGFVFDRDFNRQIPDTTTIQRLIERAWSQGFDTQGHNQLGDLVSSRTWIGATEFVALLTSLNIRTRLFDFHHPTGTADEPHPAVFACVKSYFLETPQRREGFDATIKHPLYLQHQGHSRTIVGVEDSQAGQFLLIFDPSTSLRTFRPDAQQQQQQREQGQQPPQRRLLDALRENWSCLRHKQYQIVAVDGIFASAEERNRAKAIRSISFP